MAVRSVVVVVNNFTSNELKRISVDMVHGILTPNNPPPETISANGPGSFEVESQGAATGVEGTIKYKIDDSTDLIIYIDNPFIGSNSYNVTTTGSDEYEAPYVGGNGDNATISVTLQAKK
ncbi:hypothetical protein ASPZODRAFT_137037 [Penicilliopsis zonata CBS 506.65]|uniref:Uncharacterized protein n=1 Tax=Penicilliopsis zonata CBS 506.65 TaxID=1073090 RepID=A0A1L9S673_9EURO|nr:hypothetical protein ASPZODRAFT_137037 [Penicilliopsis zonata CBS 506.65]OJJ42650.1 hypothetical protein ASPZODRAFT_137037 [Penicilliopsis zonata CBS 506.65]